MIRKYPTDNSDKSFDIVLDDAARNLCDELLYNQFKISRNILPLNQGNLQHCNKWVIGLLKNQYLRPLAH